MTERAAMHVFDRRAVARHRDRAARAWPQHDFLKREIAGRLAERLDDIRRDFPVALDLGCHGGEMAAALAGRGVRTLVQADLSAALLARAEGRRVVASEEALPFAPATFDLVTSALSLHWVNDLPGALLQIRQVLKPDGLFLAALLGGETLTELRQAWLQAESEMEGGASPRVSPFAGLRDAAGLLQRAGFALPVADLDRLTVSYPDAFTLMRELRGMGEANAVTERRRGLTRRATLLRAAEIYRDRFGDAEGRVPASFQVLYLHAWAPDAAQPRPLKPGTARHRLADALGTTEIPAGEKAGRR